MLRYAVLFVFVVIAAGQVTHNRECRTDVEVVQNFDLDKYLGMWYEISRYPVYFQRGSECCYAQYSKNDDGNLVIENTSIKLPNTTRTGVSGLGVLTDMNADPIEGKLNVAFRKATPGTESNYWILGTDYENYAIVWNCKNSDNQSADVAWILSRTPQLNADVQSAVDEIVDKYLERESLRVTIQDKEQCGYE